MRVHRDTDATFLELGSQPVTRGVERDGSADTEMRPEQGAAEFCADAFVHPDRQLHLVRYA